MCVKTYSESGQPCGFEPCDAFKRMKSQYAATNLSLCEINKERRDDIERLEAENAALRQRLESSQQDHLDTIIERDALRQDRDRLAGIVKKADALANHQMRECEACSNPCMAYGLARMYQEASHG